MSPLQIEAPTIDPIWWFAALHGLRMAPLTGYPPAVL
jgi:hypothetical protein